MSRGCCVDVLLIGNDVVDEGLNPPRVFYMAS